MPVVWEPTTDVNTPVVVVVVHFQRALLPLQVREVKVEPVLFLTSPVRHPVMPLVVEVVRLLVQLELPEVHVLRARSRQPSLLLQVQVLTPHTPEQ
jgi:hypothetical protein